mgnify:CR=1 FL=1|jgi:hypothetical protein
MVFKTSLTIIMAQTLKKEKFRRSFFEGNMPTESHLLTKSELMAYFKRSTNSNNYGEHDENEISMYDYDKTDNI